MKIKNLTKNGLFSDGDWVESKDQDPDGDVRLIQLADIGDGYFVDKSKRFMNREATKRLNCTFLEKNDILIARMPDPIGRCCLFPFDEKEKYVTVVDICILRINDGISKDYLKYAINSDLIRRRIEEQVTGTTRLRITKKKIGELEIPLPPLETQIKIAAILDAADAYRQKTKALIAKYEELTQSLFLEMFGDPVMNEKGWEVKEFEYFAKFDTKMTSNFEKYANVPHVGIANIEKESGSILGCKLVKDESLSSGKYLFGPDHIIYSKIRPNLNKVALPNFVGLCSADSYPLLVNSEKANKAFFALLLRSKSFIEFILEHSTRTNIPKANKAQMKLYQGIAPPISLQNQFAEGVQKIEAQKAQAQESLEKAEELFNSLLQRAFKGEL